MITAQVLQSTACVSKLEVSILAAINPKSLVINETSGSHSIR